MSKEPGPSVSAIARTGCAALGSAAVAILRRGRALHAFAAAIVFFAASATRASETGVVRAANSGQVDAALGARPGDTRSENARPGDGRSDDERPVGRAGTNGKFSAAALVREAVDAARAGSLDSVLSARETLLREEIGGKSAKVAIKFLEHDAGETAALQWMLLSRIGADARADPACRDCLAWILGDMPALTLFLSSGQPAAGKWGEAVRVLARVANSRERREGLPLRLSVATALVFAEPVRWMADDTPIDPVARVDSYLAWDKAGVLFPTFRELSAWEMRYVVGSWSSDDDLAWARANIKPDLRVRDKVGDGAHMLAYNLANKNGVSVQEGRKFYDNKPMTMAVMLEYGGVCGAISRFGSSMSQAFGVPAMPVGQPGHCAFIWQKEPRRWSINNDISGWAESGCHGGIFIEWGQPAWLMPLMQDAQADRDGFARAEALVALAEIAGADARAGLLAEACRRCARHYGAWTARAKSVGKSAELRKFQSELSEALAMHPAAYATVLNSAPVSLAAAGDGKRECGAAAACAAMAKAGADGGLSGWGALLVLEQGARKLAGKSDGRAARAMVFGDAPGDAKIDEAAAGKIFELMLDASQAMDVSPSGSAHDAWRRVLRCAARGGVLQPTIREQAMRRLAKGIEGLAAAKRLDDARWIADRIVEATGEVRDAGGAPDEALKQRATAMRQSLG